MQIQNLKYQFKDKIVLDIPALEFPKNAIFGLTGPNGAGKTTLLSLLAGILRIQSGTISKSPTCGLLLQNTSFYQEMTGYQNLNYFCDINSIELKHIPRILDLVKIDNKIANQKFKTLSQGTKQRLLIARAFLSKSDFILLDEPFNAVDIPTMIMMKKSIQDFVETEKKTIIISSHQLKEIEDLITYGAILNKGKLVYVFSKDDLYKTDANFSIFYKGNITSLKKYVEDNKISYKAENNHLTLYNLSDEIKWGILDFCKNKTFMITRIDFQPTLEDVFISKIQGI